MIHGSSCWPVKFKHEAVVHSQRSPACEQVTNIVHCWMQYRPLELSGKSVDDRIDLGLQTLATEA